MSYYEGYDDDIDEPFFENDDCTDTLNQLKIEIEQSVKQEIKEELAYLRKENAELQDVKEHFEEIKQNYKNEIRKAQLDSENAKKEAMKARLNEIIEQFPLTAWKVEYQRVYPPKCNKCDEYREVKIQLPSGKEVDDDCLNCGHSEQRLFIKPYTLFRISESCGDICGRYIRQYSNSRYELFEVKLYTFEEVDLSDERLTSFLFKTKEDAQKVCDSLNKEKHSDWIYNRCGKLTEVLVDLKHFEEGLEKQENE